MTRRLPLALFIAASLFAPARACGPDFPPELLANRERTLSGMVDGVFDFEAENLMLPGDGLRATPTDPWEPYDERRSKAEAVGMSEAQVALIKEIRSSASLTAAQALDASGLPEAVKLYSEGALAYGLGELDAATERFTAVVNLSEAQRQPRELWAHYMLGLIDVRYGDGKSAPGHLAKVRELTLSGRPDPLSLAVASLGEEGFLHLSRGHVGLAVLSYAEQAARQDHSGHASLLILARRIAKEPELLREHVQQPAVQALMAAYAFTRSDELLDEEARWAKFEQFGESGVVAMDATLVERLAEVAESAGIKNWRGADRLAAAAYRAGRFELAERWLASAQGPLALWVNSKLLLRDGKAEAALLALTQASEAFPEQETWGENSQSAYFQSNPRCRVKAEHAALLLSRDDYVQAAELFFQAGGDYWNDLAHVAERVLSLDELVALSTRLAPIALPAPDAAAAAAEHGYDYAPPKRVPSTELRALTARRLMRSANPEQALAWVDPPELRALADDYVKAYESAQIGAALARAAAAYRAAQLARTHGMQLMGFERDPDYAIYDGAYDLNSPFEYDADYNLIVKQRADIQLGQAWVSAGERARVSASAAQPLKRFHYRYIASDWAVQAAALLPPRSQAFAAVMCYATRVIIDQDQELATKLYRRYLNEGPYVAWGRDFGRTCPTPDFAKAQRDLDAKRWAEYRRSARKALPWVLGLAVLAFGAAFLAWRKRKRTPLARTPL